MALGDRIKKIRNGLSQKDFGSKFGITANTLRRYENEENPPDADFLVAVCAHYGVNPSWLLMGFDPMYPSETAPREATTTAVDEHLLGAVIEAVEEYLNDVKGRLAPAKKAQLVSALYDIFLTEEGKKVDKAVVIRFAKLAA